MLVTSEVMPEPGLAAGGWSTPPGSAPSYSAWTLPQSRAEATRRYLSHYALPRVLVVAYLCVAVLATVFATRQAALDTVANSQAAAAYQSDFGQWFADVSLAQRQFNGAVTSSMSGSDGRRIVGVSLADGGALRVAASDACLPTSGVGLGSTVTVLRVPGDASVPAMFKSDSSCLTPDDVTATASAPQLPEYTPVRWYAALQVLALLGLTLTVVGARRTLLRQRWQATINPRTGLARRNLALSVGAGMMLAAVMLYPFVDRAAPAVWALLRRYGL